MAPDHPAENNDSNEYFIKRKDTSLRESARKVGFITAAFFAGVLLMLFAKSCTLALSAGVIA